MIRLSSAALVLVPGPGASTAQADPSLYTRTARSTAQPDTMAPRPNPLVTTPSAPLATSLNEGSDDMMMTPELDFGAGATLTFYTRKVSPDSYADRLEVRLSTNGASTHAGSNATTVGDFTNVVLSIDPTLVLGVYPTVFTQYTVSGLPHSGTVRIGFR